MTPNCPCRGISPITSAARLYRSFHALLMQGMAAREVLRANTTVSPYHPRQALPPGLAHFESHRTPKQRGGPAIHVMLREGAMLL